MSQDAKVQRPSELANHLFDAVLGQCKNDPRAAAQMCINFLTEALVYAISSSAGDEVARKALLKSVGETIIAAPLLGKP